MMLKFHILLVISATVLISALQNNERQKIYDAKSYLFTV